MSEDELAAVLPDLAPQARHGVWLASGRPDPLAHLTAGSPPPADASSSAEHDAQPMAEMPASQSANLLPAIVTRPSPYRSGRSAGRDPLGGQSSAAPSRLPEIAAVSCGNAKIRSQTRIMIMLNGPAAIAAWPSDLRFQWGANDRTQLTRGYGGFPGWSSRVKRAGLPAFCLF